LDVEAMVDQVKEMQRSDPIAKEQWHAFCDQYGEGVRDPAKHDVSFLNSFVSQYTSGARLEYKEGGELVKFIKLGQRKSQGWKAAWEAYCAERPKNNGRPEHDPAKHDSSFLEGFFDFIGRAYYSTSMMGSSMGYGGAGMGMGMGMSAPPAKRGYGGMGTTTGDPMRDQLIAKIKAFQRTGEAAKQTWHTFCDTSLGGMYDPSRHDAATLQMFIDSNGINDIPMGGMGGGGGGGVGANHPLVMRIKNYQRQGEAQKQAWHTYCDTSLGGKYDPSRHEESALNTFIMTYGVP
jgi:hypothetical protein